MLTVHVDDRAKRSSIPQPGAEIEDDDLLDEAAGRARSRQAADPRSNRGRATSSGESRRSRFLGEYINHHVKEEEGRCSRKSAQPTWISTSWRQQLMARNAGH